MMMILDLEACYWSLSLKQQRERERGIHFCPMDCLCRTRTLLWDLREAGLPFATTEPKTIKLP